MDQTPHERLCSIFEEALELEGHGRKEFLDQACGEDLALRKMVDKMLLADTAKSKAGLGVAVEMNLEEEFGDAKIPEQIGPYRIVRRIGAGGMGIVYEAQQEKPQRSVALKVMRAGTSQKQRERFEFESEVLGSLQHPNIAHIYGAGTATTDTGQQPWISMELVDGQPIDDFARGNEMGVKAKLGLVIQVLEGVSHAHSKGVVHRDLKPGNVLVDASCAPHIVDFGVARIVEGWDGETRTQMGDIVGTIAYMSPEQVSGDPGRVSTQSDIYSVGTMAFELVTGDLPLDLQGKSITQAIETIREGKQRSLRSDYGLSHDLNSVIGKALDPEPERRYQSAEAFAEDLRRYLRGDAILARPPSALYQLKCLGRRNKVASVAIGAALVAILGGGAFSTYLFFKEQEANKKAAAALNEASDSRDEAVRQAELSSRGLEYYGNLIAQAGSSFQGRQMTVGELVEQGASGVSEVFADSPLHQAHLLVAFAIASHNNGLVDEAIERVERVIGLIEDTPLKDPMLANSAYLQYSLSLQAAHRYQEALEAAEKAVAVVEGLEDEEGKFMHARAVERLAYRHAAIGDRQKGLDLLEGVIVNIDELKGTPGFQGNLLKTKARLQFALSRFEESAETARESLVWLKKDGVEKGPVGISASLSLGAALSRMGKVEQAIEILNPLVEAELEVNGPGRGHCDILKRIAECYARGSKHDQAIGKYSEAIEAFEPLKRNPDLFSATCRLEMGKAYEALAQDDQAMAVFRSAILDLEGSQTTSQYSRRGSARWGLARTLRKENKFEEALDSINASIADFEMRKSIAPGNPNISPVLHLRATLYTDLERWDMAGKCTFETLKFGVDNGFSKELWPGLISTLRTQMSDHPEAFVDTVEEVDALLRAAEKETES